MLVTQSLPKGFDSEKAKAYHLKTAAFRDWQHKLNRNDQLPRGKFFKGKQAGKTIILIDECWQFFPKTEL